MINSVKDVGTITLRPCEAYHVDASRSTVFLPVPDTVVRQVCRSCTWFEWAFPVVSRLQERELSIRRAGHVKYREPVVG